MKITMILTMLGVLALLALLFGCSPDGGAHRERAYHFTFECTVDRVDGTFYSYRSYIRSNKRMLVMFRVTNGERRAFMFPSERVSCAEVVDG